MSKAIHRRGVLDIWGTNSTFITAKIAASESVLYAKIADECGALLAGDVLDRSLLASLRARSHYEIALRTVSNLSGRPDQIIQLLSCPPISRVAPYRFARFFGAISGDDEVTPLTLDTLRSMETEAAKCALAACADDFDWKGSTPRARAVFVLRALIEAGRS